LFYGERLNDGRQKFEDALALIERVRDEKSFKCYMRGFTYQRWMIAEFCLGNNTVANEKFELAKSEFQQIAIIPLRAQLLASLHQAAGRPLFPSPSAS
jgi:hypothetical protein